MKPHQLLALFLFSALLLLALPAHALGPFSWPGQADVPPLGRDFTLGTMLAEDKDGAIYLTNGKCQASATGDWQIFAPTDTDAWGLAPDADGVVGWLTTPGTQVNQEHVQIVRLRCNDVFLKSGASNAWQELASFDRPAKKTNLKNQPLLVAKDGSICHVLPDGAGLECATIQAGKAQLDMRLDVSDLDARLGLKAVPSDKIPPGDQFVPKLAETWRVRYGTFAPDGRLFLVAERQTWTYGADGVTYAHPDWLLQIAPGPQPPIVPGQPKPIAALKDMPGAGADGRIVWEPKLGMIALFSAGDYSHVQRSVKGGDGAGNGVSVDFGRAGAGLTLLDFDHRATAYISLTDAIARRRECTTATIDALTCESGFGQPHLWQRPNGDIGIVLPFTNLKGVGDVDRAMRLYVVQFDEKTLDLDSDGLTRQQEAELGTSDWNEDSDGGGTVDNTELLISKSNPLQQGDDPWQLVARPGTFALVRSSLLFGLRDFAAIKNVKSFAETWSTQGPLCADGVCLDVDGQVVAHYNPQQNAIKSADGTHLLVMGPGGWYRLFFGDGRLELAVTLDDLNQLLPPSVTEQAGPLRLLPVDARTLFVAREYGGAKLAIFERDKPGRVLFDVQKSRCDSGLGPCDNHPAGAAKTLLPVHDIPRDELHLLGYIPTTQRVMLGVAGSWDLYLLGVHATEPLAVMRHGPSLGDLLHWIFPIGTCDPGSRTCDLLSDAGLMDPYLTTRATWLGNQLKDVPAQPHFSGAWGDTALRIADGVEMVRYEPGVAPGDVLIAQPVDAPVGSEGVMLYVSKPRGGRVPLWPEVEMGLKGVDGMDVTADGTLCLADRQGRRIWEYTAEFDRIPSLLRLNAEVGEILDCKYSANGDLNLLFNDPPRIEVRKGQQMETVPGQALEPGKHPQQLVKKPDGTLEVLYVEDNVRGRLYTAAGQKVEIAQSSQQVTSDGKPLVALTLWWLSANSPSMETWQGRVTMAERPDGLIFIGGTHAALDQMFVVQSRFYAVDPQTGRAPQPWEDSHFGIWALAAAVVPGGKAVDPWTHRPKVLAGPNESSDTPGAAPSAPTGGVKQEVPQSAAKGCHAGRTSSPSWLLLAGLCAAWALRKKLVTEKT